MEELIVADSAGQTGESPPIVIMLGDYVDRGPESGRVIEHLLGQPKGFRRICLAGNHELAMLEFLDDPRRSADWLAFDSEPTLASYGILATDLLQLSSRGIRQVIDSHIPREHRDFLASLPLLLETPDYIFVHAGLRPGLALPDQQDRDLCQFRDDFEADYCEFGRIVVHGHTPVTEPVVLPHRIGIDTGAYFSGRLSAVALSAGQAPRILTARGAAVAPMLRTP